MTNNDAPIPGMMQIMRAVASVTHLTTAIIQSRSRLTQVVTARAAFCKLAEQYGYSNAEIMWFVDRDRTAGYNYTKNLDGYLATDASFADLLQAARRALNEHPYRALKAPKKEKIMQPTTPSQQATQPITPLAGVLVGRSEPYKSPFGWQFTPSEYNEMLRAMFESIGFMETYGKPRTPPLPCDVPPMPELPEEMGTTEAANYIGVSPSTLTKYAKLMSVEFFKKPHSKGYWYKRCQVEELKAKIQATKQEG
jgi:hypothetical protein